ncbi:SDR family NAD(P)-dependent oxidoreductase [Lichenifustis flavocetrariae]|uniref:SDR family oxidoreductase n=1 Tax=Lichenifustis flavocetrariae TaxID=2949735 RepID=A0AA41Z1N1_9HYPH|nr:SDR family NAD(P)-dependent oxidoreductase [Lichenifustis flavocetrariae]MCW6512554.1 SDR family oxidoreductase [Lichenifustis flavocetrariae]
MPLRHSGKTVLVTGGASGIGLGIARRFLVDGANVAIVDLQAPLDVLEGSPLVLSGDATQEADMQDAVDKTVEAFGRLDIAVNNAGVIGIGPVADMDFAEWRRVVDTNIHSVFLGARAAARQMIAQGQGGSIINASSGAGRKGVANIAHYCASKSAIIMLTQAMSVELAPHRIRVNAYAPGHIETPFWGGISQGFARVTGKTPEQVVADFAASVPWGRFGTPADVAATVSWLASDEADYISGQTIAMNGAEFPT